LGEKANGTGIPGSYRKGPELKIFLFFFNVQQGTNLSVKAVGKEKNAKILDMLYNFCKFMG